MAPKAATPPPNLRLERGENGEWCAHLIGRIDANSAGALWAELLEVAQREKPRRLLIQGSEIDYFDTTGVGLIMNVRSLVESGGGKLDLEGLDEKYQKLFELFDAEASSEQLADKGEQHSSLPEDVGKSAAGMLDDARRQIAFIGELASALVQAAKHPAHVRWKDCLRTAETAGVNAFPIVVLIGFLIGLIMAFQSAIPMKQFGADIFVANLVALSMLRELGPLMTAIVLAGRSSSAFAAEIGTMKVNEEVNALETMGLNPVPFLVVPRVIAAVVMTPFLTIFANLAGLIGGLVVMLSLGYPFVTYFNQVTGAAGLTDVLGGLVKAFFFGILVAGVGCLRGLETKTGPSAVGDSTTRAVVSSIVLIAITDGVFSVVYYFLGI